MCTGRRKSMWSMDAVTTWLCECLCAANAPAISIKCMSLPPSRLPSGLASFGRTTSAICDCDSLTGRGGTIWIGVSWPSCEFILSFSHEDFGYRALPRGICRLYGSAQQSRPCFIGTWRIDHARESSRHGRMITYKMCMSYSRASSGFAARSTGLAVRGRRSRYTATKHSA